MSCPDWPRCVALQDEEPQAWDDALRHLDSCDACFDEAMDADPTVLFRRLPAPETSAADIASIKDAVATMRRTEPMARRTAPPPRRRRYALAIAATLAMVAALSGGWPGGSTDPQVASLETDLVHEAETFDARPSEDEFPSFEDVPLVEDLDPTYGSVVQVMDGEMSLVLVLPNGDVS